MSSIALATTEKQIRSCFPVMAQLRPHVTEPEFVARVKKQQREGYELAFLSDCRQVKAVAGFRVGNSLAWGKFLYVDDLVTDEVFRSRGHGQQLFDWLVREARKRACDQFHLDSGVQRFGAHRFYLRNRMDILAYHFTLKL